MRALLYLILLTGFSLSATASPPVPARKSDVVGNHEQAIDVHIKDKEQIGRAHV